MRGAWGKILCTAVFVGGVFVAPTPARAFDWGSVLTPWKTSAERWVERIDGARQRGELDLANTLLEVAERELGPNVPGLVLARGLVLRDRGRLVEAVPVLERAAKLEPTSLARLEQSATLVALGRWPEAVDVLGEAFSERGAALRGEQVLSDARFAPLVGFGPFDDLMKTVRAEQSGPLGRLLLKFEQIEASARTADRVLTGVASWMGMVRRLASFGGTAVVVLIGFGLFLTVGVNQLGLFRPPWPLILGMSAGSTLWYFGARIATADKSSGFSTIGMAMAVVFVPWLLMLLGRTLVRRYRGTFDPFDATHLGATVALLEEVAIAGHRVLVATDEGKAAATSELRRAEEALRERLLGQH